MPKYRYVSSEQANLDSDEQGSWRVLLLFVYYRKSILAEEFFPTTMRLLSQMPGASQAFFSIVEPNVKLKGHYGIYEGVMR